MPLRACARTCAAWYRAAILCCVAIPVLAVGVGCGEGGAPTAREDAEHVLDVQVQEAEQLREDARKGALVKGVDLAEEEAKKAAADAEAEGVAGIAESARERVERSAGVAERTYDSARQAGQGEIEAAGEAYESILKQGQEAAPE